MLYLASKSPRRRELLGHLGVDFEVVDVDVPEHRGAGESALDYVARVARDKALAGLVRVGRDADAVVIGADTEVILDDAVFGKPANDADAAAMLRRLSGRTHDAVSAVSVVSAMGEEGALCVSEVTFAVLDEPTIARYIATGEPHGKAGAYAIQGAAQSFIAHLSGSHSGVMGLPLHETASLLRAFNVIAEGGVLPRIGAEDDADPAVPGGVATTGASAASARSAPPPSSAAAGSASASAPILGKEKSPQQTQGTDER